MLKLNYLCARNGIRCQDKQLPLRLSFLILPLGVFETHLISLCGEQRTRHWSQTLEVFAKLFKTESPQLLGLMNFFSWPLVFIWNVVLAGIQFKVKKECGLSGGIATESELFLHKSSLTPHTWLTHSWKKKTKKRKNKAENICIQDVSLTFVWLNV